MKRTNHIRRRHQHVGIINGAMWGAHDRRVTGSNGAP